MTAQETAKSLAPITKYVLIRQAFNGTRESVCVRFQCLSGHQSVSVISVCPDCQSTSDNEDSSQSTSFVVVVVVVVVESDVTRICGSRTALQTGRHELRRPVNLVADCDDRRCLDEEATDPERVNGDRGFHAVVLRVCSTTSSELRLSSTTCSTTGARLHETSDGQSQI